MFKEGALYVASKRKALEHKEELPGSAPPVFVIVAGLIVGVTI
jgi:hypothetical protein